MFTALLEQISHFIIQVISQAGYLGIVLLMGIESACIPLPSEVIMPFSGYLAYTGRFSLWWVGVAGAFGCNVGSVVAYYAGAYGGRPLLVKYGRYLLLSQKDLDWADRWFTRYGEATVFFARLLPVIRTFIALPAGIARMDFWRFNLYTFAGSLPWCLALAYAGMKLGEHWTRLRIYFEKLDFAIGAVILVAIYYYIRSHLRNRVRANLL